MPTEEKINASFKILNDLYSTIPPTTGCGRANQPGGCGAWCCAYNSPSMYVSEFLYLWKWVSENLSKEDKIEVILNSVANYLRSTPVKGCPAFDGVSKKCKCHPSRPMICRVYGVIHHNKWESRTKRYKETVGEIPKNQRELVNRILNQCDLVKLKDGKRHISEKMDDAYFEETRKAEKELGVDEKTIDLHDAPQGSYRCLHDHIMMNTFSADYLTMLSEYRRDKISEAETNKLVNQIRSQFEQQDKIKVTEVSQGGNST